MEKKREGEKEEKYGAERKLWTQKGMGYTSIMGYKQWQIIFRVQKPNANPMRSRMRSRKAKKKTKKAKL